MFQVSISQWKFGDFLGRIWSHIPNVECPSQAWMRGNSQEKCSEQDEGRTEGQQPGDENRGILESSLVA